MDKRTISFIIVIFFAVLACVLAVFAIDNVVAGDELIVTFLASNGSIISKGECRANIYNSSGDWNAVATNAMMGEVGVTGHYNYSIPTTWSGKFTGSANCNKSTTLTAGTELEFFVVPTADIWQENLSVVTNTDSAGYRLYNFANLVWSYALRTITGGNITSGNISNIDSIDYIGFVKYVETLG